jgi:hypothetical protein
MRRYFLLLAICGACSAQSIDGTVEDSLTGQPLAGAHVVFAGAAATDRHASISDRAGHFQHVFDKATAYQIVVRRSGYLVAEQPLSVTPGQSSSDLRIQLTPWAVISGKLEDEDGFPVEEVSLRALPYDVVNGQPKLRKAAAWATSNDLGEFRLTGLPAGSYYIQATPSSNRRWDRRYVRQYYPGSLEPVEATAVQLAAGEERSGVTFTVKKHEGVTVTGRVVLPAGVKTAPSMHWIWLQSADEPSNALDSTSWQQDDPTFTFRHVPPGTYNVFWSSAGFGKLNPGDVLLRQEVQVGNADVTDVVATFHVVDASGK